MNRQDSLTLDSGPGILLADGRQLSLQRPLVMGVLNVTPDSFSDGNAFNTLAEAVAHALRMEADGADLIDIGGESSRPGAQPVAADEERRRVEPVIAGVRKESSIPISIDTYHAETARAALDAGADIINDISALRFDSAMASLAAATDVPVILMHMLGTPRDMQKNPYYDDCVAEICQFFQERIDFCRRHGIESPRLILDPGIGFGKRLSDNLNLLAGLERLRSLGRPVLVGASRKSFIQKVYPTDKPASERLGGSLAAAVLAVLHGASMVRVHDVSPTVEAMKVLSAIREST